MLSDYVIQPLHNKTFEKLLFSFEVKPNMLDIYENELMAEYGKKNNSRTEAGKQRYPLCRYRPSMRS